MRILEATIAVLIVSGVMIAVYSGQIASEDTTSQYFYDLQNGVLDGISSDIDLRLAVLNVVEEDLSDGNFSRLNDFVEGKIPISLDYSIRVCDLSAESCKMDNDTYISTLGKEIFVEEAIVSAEVGAGIDAVYNPKKVRLFSWKIGDDIGGCVSECSVGGSVLSCSGLNVVSKTCGEFDDDECLEYGEAAFVKTCADGCLGGECVVGGGAVAGTRLVCRGTQRENQVDGLCVSNFDDECTNAGYDDGEDTGGGCGWFRDEYSCWNYVKVTGECAGTPVCPSGYPTEVSREDCVMS